MENTFIQEGIDLVTKAVAADREENHEEALNFYRDALHRFTLGLKYEKNNARRKLLMERVEGYMKRAEQLKQHLKEQNEVDKDGPGGAATKSKDDKTSDDDEKRKLRGALAGAIVTEKPNVKWSDVAGLEMAKETLKEVSMNEYIAMMIMMEFRILTKRTHFQDCDYAHTFSTIIYWKTPAFQRYLTIWSSRYRKIVLGQGCGHRSRFYFLHRIFRGLG